MVSRGGVKTPSPFPWPMSARQVGWLSEPPCRRRTGREPQGAVSIGSMSTLCCDGASHEPTQGAFGEGRSSYLKTVRGWTLSARASFY